MQPFVFRQATAADCAFISQAIVQAERLPNGPSSYATLFGLSEAEVLTLLEQALTLSGGGCGLALNQFFVITQDARCLACCAAWIEAADGVSSGFKSAAALSSLLGLRAWQAAAPAIKVFAQASPVRTPLTLQLESFYVAPLARGHGLVQRLIKGVFDHFKRTAPDLHQAQISLLVENTAAFRAYTLAGFQAQRTDPVDHPQFYQLTGSTGMMQLIFDLA